MRATFLFGVSLLFFLLALFLLWPLPVQLGSSVLDAGDPLLYAWSLRHNFQAFTGNMGTLLDTNIYYPSTNTLALADTHFGQTVLMAPFLWITGNPLFAVNLYTILTFPIAGIGMMLLTYHLTKHTAASFVSGLFFAFSIPRIGQITHMPAVSSQWLPFLFLFLLRYGQEGKQRDLALYVLFLILLTTSTMYFFVFGVLASCIIILGYCVSYLQKRDLRTLRARLLGAIPLSFLFGIVFLIVSFPYIRLKAENPGIKRTIDEAAVFAAYQQDYASVPTTSLLYRTVLRTQEGERTLFPTITLLLIALLSLTYIRTWTKETTLLALVGLMALILSFGPARPFHIGPVETGYIPLPYTILYKTFPLLQMIRVPARFSILFVLGLSALAGVALSRLSIKKGNRLLYIVISGVYLLEVWQLPHTVVSVPSYASVPAVYQFIKDIDEARIVELPIGRIESGKTPIPQQVKKPYHTLTVDDPLATEAYRTYFSGYHLKQMANGYSGFVPTSFHETVDAMGSFPSDPSITFLKQQGISHVIIHAWQYPTEEKNELLQQVRLQTRLKKIAQFGDDSVYEVAN